MRSKHLLNGVVSSTVGGFSGRLHFYRQAARAFGIVTVAHLILSIKNVNNDWNTSRKAYCIRNLITER